MSAASTDIIVPANIPLLCSCCPPWEPSEIVPRIERTRYSVFMRQPAFLDAPTYYLSRQAAGGSASCGTGQVAARTRVIAVHDDPNVNPATTTTDTDSCVPDSTSFPVFDSPFAVTSIPDGDAINDGTLQQTGLGDFAFMTNELRDRGLGQFGPTGTRGLERIVSESTGLEWVIDISEVPPDFDPLPAEFRYYRATILRQIVVTVGSSVTRTNSAIVFAGPVTDAHRAAGEIRVPLDPLINPPAPSDLPTPAGSNWTTIREDRRVANIFGISGPSPGPELTPRVEFSVV